MRPPKSLGIVGLDVDKAETGASFLVASSLDSVITRWSIEGESEGRVELGPGAFGPFFRFTRWVLTPLCAA